MKKIRYGFESNSSSSHTVSIRSTYNKGKLYPLTDKVVRGYFGEFGWETVGYDQPNMKLSYALTMVAETELKYPKTIEKFYETDGYKQIVECIRENDGRDLVVELNRDEYYPFGYIDHQSAIDCYNNLQEFLDDYGMSLSDFIFNKNIILRTGNDN